MLIVSKLRTIFLNTIQGKKKEKNENLTQSFKSQKVIKIYNHPYRKSRQTL